MLTSIDDDSYWLREITRLLDAQEGWDWNAFATTLLATLFGAAFSGTVAWLVFRGEKRDRYDSRLDESLSNLMTVIQHRMDSIVHFQIQFTTLRFQANGVPYSLDELGLTEPLSFAVNTAANSVAMVARKEDSEVAVAIREAIGRIEERPLEDQMPALAQVAATVSEWRSGRWSRLQALNELRALPGSVLGTAEAPPSVT